jgi:hypothetical protein
MINILAVIVAIIIYWILGAIWFSAKVLGKKWSIALGKNIDELGPNIKQALGSFLANSIAIVVLAILLELIGSYDLVTGLTVALLIGIGFIIPIDLYDVIFEEKNRLAFLIDIGYHVFGIVIAGIILGLWII